MKNFGRKRQQKGKELENNPFSFLAVEKKSIGGLTVNRLIAQIPTIMLWFIGNNPLVKPRRIKRLIKCRNVYSFVGPKILP